MKKKNVIIGVILVVVAAAAVSGVAAWKKIQDGTLELPFQKKSDTVEGSVYVDSVAKIMDPDVGGTNQRFSGVIEPQKTWKIEASSDKKVKDIFVEEGDQVKAGQDLFTYDTAEAEENLVEAEIELDRLTSDIETTRKQIENMKTELSKVTGEDERLEYTNLIQTKENSLKKSEYDLKKQNVTIEQLKNSIANSTVQSEMDGVIQKINEDAGSNSSYYGYGSDDSNAFMTVLATGNYRVKGTANEQNRNAVQQGLPVIVHSRVNDDDVWSGIMGSLDTENTAQQNTDYYYYGGGSNDNSSSNYNFYVDLDSSDGLILGQHVYIEIDNGQYKHTDGIWLNSYYIMQDEDGKGYVWAADSRDRMEEREVTLGEYDGELDMYEITEGLTEEDYIAFPSADIEAGMRAERNLENATIGMGASGAIGIGGGETYIDDGSYDGDFIDEGEIGYDDNGDFIDEGEIGDDGYVDDMGEGVETGEEYLGGLEEDPEAGDDLSGMEVDPGAKDELSSLEGDPNAAGSIAEEEEP